MSFLQALGAAGQGLSAGIQDLERMDENKAKKKQREFQEKVQARQEADWSEEDDLRGRLRGIRRTNEAYSDPKVTAGGVTRDDDGNLMPGVAQVARPQADVMADEANAYLGLSSPKLRAQGITLQAAARTQKDNDRKDDAQKREDAVFNTYRPDFESIRQSPQAAFEWLDNKGLSAYNAKVPDGHRAGVTKNEDGSRTYTVLDKDNKPVNVFNVTPEQAQEAAATKLRGLMNHDLGTLSKDDFRAFMSGQLDERKTNIAQQGADAQSTNAASGQISAASGQVSANASMLNAQSDAEYRKAGGVWDLAQQASRNAQLQVARMNQASQGILNPLQKHQLDESVNYAEMSAQFAKLMTDPKANASALRTLAGQLAIRHPEKSTSVTKVRNADGGEDAVQINRYDFLVKNALKGAGVVELPMTFKPLLDAAAKSAKTDKAKFLSSDAAKRAVAAGVNPDELAAEYGYK